MIGGGLDQYAEAEPGHGVEADALRGSQLAEKLQHLAARVVHVGPGDVAFVDQQDGGAGFGRLGGGGRSSRVRIRDWRRCEGAPFARRCWRWGSRRGRGSGGRRTEEPDLLLAAVVVHLEVVGLQIGDGMALLVVGHDAHIDQARGDLDREATRGPGLIGWSIGHAV